MKHFLLLAFIFQNIITAQEDKKTNNSFLSDTVSIEGEGGSFLNTFSEYRINDDWVFRAEHNAKRISGLGSGFSVFEFPMLAKYEISNKLNVLFGPKTNLFYINGNLDHISTFATFGLEYEVTNSLIIEGRMSLPLTNQENLSKYESIGIEPTYKLGTRFKF